jgi:phosphoglycolate phosphatase
MKTSAKLQPTFDAILFDLDGTLIETAPEICDAVNDTLAHYDMGFVSQELVNNWIGHGTHELLIQALSFVGKTSEEKIRQSTGLKPIAAEFDRNYQKRCGTRSHLYPHVREVLATLRAQGVKLAVVTNKEGRYTQTILEVHKLTDQFDAVISGDTLSVKKPNPAGIQHCLDQFGVSKERALFVGDSSIDVATARNADVTVWALPYGYNMGQPIESCAPDRVIADFLAILKPC